jgi:site-specific DNA-methyltransferase (adenine-specific)
MDGAQIGHGDSGTASRFFYCAKPGRAERELGLDGFRPTRASEVTGERKDDSLGLNSPRAGAGRTGGARNRHPTVKSIDLMRWLIRLVTPPGGVVLDQFCGSGSTGMAAILEGMRFIGIELNDTEDEPFVSLARARIAHCAGWKTPPVRDAEPPRQRSLFEEMDG